MENRALVLHEFDPQTVERALHGQRIDWVKFDRGAIDLTLTQIMGKRLVFDFGHSSARTSYGGVLDKDSSRFRCLIGGGTGESRFRGHTLPPHCIDHLKPGAEFEGFYAPQASWASANFRHESLRSLVSLYGGERAGEALDRFDYVSQPTDAAAHAAIRKLLDAARGKIAFQHGAAEAFEADLIDLVVRTFASGLDIERRGPRHETRRYRLARQVRDLVEQHQHEQLRLPEIARRLAVSVRTLEYALQSVHGVSVGAYMRTLRLNRTYRALLAADPECHSVTEIAMDWGFWHLGEFSALYRRHFGEAPSATLKRGARPLRATVLRPASRTVGSHTMVTTSG